MEASKLLSSSLSSNPITHLRLKRLGELAQSTEDHVSRLAMALSVRAGAVPPDWAPNPDEEEGESATGFKEKHLKGSTLFKDDLGLWMALTLKHQEPQDYLAWRRVLIAHWERGVEELSMISKREGDWIRTVHACLPE